ncbi:unnamed protein product [Cylicocyclus nassatus]|uniref:Methyltransferase FkbM domain-containing protein n=1 Tax=Cylicocyclus nassatus TaxID=53992 RepID=A0AA36HAW3_CYLNA|nr:unnamed protein product [Cylicocyclus nassatus]
MVHLSACLLMIVVIACVFLFSRSGRSNSSTSIEIEKSSRSGGDTPLKIRIIYNDWHQCINDILLPVMADPKKLWSIFGESIETCRQQTAMDKLNLTEHSNKEEIKYHIHNNTDITPSVVVTLGVGRNILAEQQLKELLPQGSLFFGADPIYEGNDRLYSTIGTFLPIAVSNETKLGQAYVLKKGYVYQTMVHIDVITLLVKLTKTPFIDQFLIDNEGPEYDIIPMMGVNDEFDKNGLVACQINVEFHAYNNFHERFVFVLKKLLDDRRYAILKASREPHYRVFMLNFEHAKCVEKYIMHYFV